MEVSSYPLVSEDLSQFYPTPYPELQTYPTPTHSPWKRQRKDDGSKTNHYDHMLPNVDMNAIADSTMKDILSNMFTFEEEDDHCLNELMNRSHIQKEETIEDCFNQLQSQVLKPGSVLVKQGAGTKRIRSSQRDGGTQALDVGSAARDTGAAHPTHQRRLWVKDRSKDWWEKCSHPDFPEEEFKKGFRMSKQTFVMICEELEPIITKKDTMLRAAIPVRQRVAVCIWRLATGEPLRLVSKRFGLGISTCHKLVLEVCLAIKTALMSKFLQWPDVSRLDRIKKDFESISGIPDVGGSMYTTHIPIIAPKASVAAYFNKRHTDRNQKTSYSITVQGVVDPNGVFTDVCIGWPGSMLDDQILEKSALFQRANMGLLNNSWMVGNSSFPLMDWVLVPYTHPNLTWAQHAFNEKIGETQKVATRAFSRLKGRWGCLRKRTEVKLQDLPIVLGACCVLHNICELQGETMDLELEGAFELFDDQVPPENPIRSASAAQHRDHIAHKLLHHGLGATSFL